MPTSEQHFLVITSLGTDRPGIVNTITRLVSTCGCNIEDSRLAMFGEEFTFIMLLSGSWNSITLIESALPQKGAELDLLIVMKRTRCGVQTKFPSTVTVKVDVDDSPGIVERFTSLFTAQNLNIAELVSKTHSAEEKTPARLQIQITGHHPLDDKGTLFKETFYRLCKELNAQGVISVQDHLKS
ncbi:glycine cleavage system transcriptional repressor [Xenorhabdus nematophila]|uniref:Glycine cleavage system transcriptional repressor n=1 Tax=Xenorhabdus nematophila (strain ATCC 19061 / DSM 3370 / CCUG 14189 / LMG 1036 / NCIMB 9965 / AN6) TaxID=406817 RepID=D3VI78_XENNA|nr:glycine cleavage system transcriptional repressor [Xenorhabdus nematophila]CEF29312.1 transcriptional repressor for cleavage of glycine [Xenorhabdus nematophila str. Websteri]AYA39989.1 glycine cleavage system transcriptional repressor [Xenorhabdus nematophila]MBA0018627.1 glycine cleavage system transcriptional repressor [Xenorhabdus nematophila]MCB4425756.1 glycine cleavage system transcriptional repressor [Xenorhabdus nematophila]QNJ37633.1 glycine cleavage system transcriptional repress